MFVDSEVLTAGHGIAIIRNSIKGWNAPHHTEMLSDEKKRSIIDNISRALQSCTEPVEIL
jgi:hypothetical protein